MPEREPQSISSCLDDNLAAAFLEGRLSEAALSEVEAHLGDCNACRRLLSLLAKTISHTSSLLPSVEVTSSTGRPGAPTNDILLPKGAVVGRYVLLRPLGIGGMGVVYAAYDPELERRIALKLVRPDSSRAGESGQGRLLREAQAMARLSHPNVISVHDVGTAGDRVFLAMELVEGVTLSQWLKHTPRSQKDILAQFLQAGRGLAAAHAAGLVHRDFKPDNVLVGSDGRVRVTDFGLACAAVGDREATVSSTQAADVTVTNTGAIIGTPAYMAPEQHLGRPVDARTDQFGFCVALYEGVCGRRPFAGDTLKELAAAVAHGSPCVPASNTRMPRWLWQAIRRGLSTAPEERYPSMEMLLEALGKDPAAIWRRRAAAIAGILIVGLGTLGYYHARRNNQLLCKGAEGQLEGVWDARVSQAVETSFRNSAKPYAEDAFRSVAFELNRYARSWVEMHTDACEATRVRGAQSDEILSLRMVCLDRRRKELHALSALFAHADAKVVEKAHQATRGLPELSDCADLQALTARPRLPRDQNRRARVEEIESALARVRVLGDAGKYAEELALATSAVDQAKAAGDRPTLAKALYRLGLSQDRSGQAREAERTLAGAVLEAEASGDDDLKARSLTLMARIVGGDRFEQSHELARRAAATIDRLGGDPRLAIRLHLAEGQTFDFEGVYPQFLDHIERAQSLEAKLPTPDPALSTLLTSNRAIALGRLGRFQEALEQQQAVLGSREKRVGNRHPEVAEALHNICITLQEMKRFDEALPPIRRAVQIFEETLGPNHPTLSISLDTLANVLGQIHRSSEAEAAYRRSLEIKRKSFGPGDERVAMSLSNLANLRQDEGKLGEAAALYREALTLAEKAVGPVHPDLAHPLVGLATVERRQRRFADSLTHAERALAISEQAFGPDHPNVADVLMLIAEVYANERQYERAVRASERALRICEQRPDDREQLSAARFALGKLLWKRGVDRPRAQQLVVAARAFYLKANTREELAEVDQWLKRR